MRNSRWKRSIENGELILTCESSGYKIKQLSDGYYLVNEDQSLIEQVGLQYDTTNEVIAVADQKLYELKAKERNLALEMLTQIVSVLKKYTTDNTRFNELRQYLTLGQQLPSSHIPQYIKKISKEQLYNSLYYYVTEDDYAFILRMISRIVEIDPHSQSAITNYNDLINGRYSTVERLVGVTAVNERGKLVFKKAGYDKVFESYETVEEKDLHCDGITIIIQEYNVDVVIDVIFLNGKVYMILNDNNTDYHDLIDRDKNVLSEIQREYGIDLLDYIKDSDFMKETINEAFGGIDMNEFKSDDHSDNSNDDKENDDLNEIVEDVDPEVQREIEIIEDNIARIEDLPDDIRENDSIKEIYLLLLGKREEIQRQHDNQKSQEVVDNIVDDITKELGDIDIMFNKNNDSNEIKVEEGKVIEYKGSMIKPMISKRYNDKTRYLIVENAGHKDKHVVSNEKDIRLIIQSL